MTVHIPVIALWALATTIVWYAVGYVLNGVVVVRLRDRSMRKRRTSVVPDWSMRVMYCMCGPVGMLAWIIDAYDHIRYSQRRKRRSGVDKP